MRFWVGFTMADKKQELEAARREQILQAARAAFARKGYERTTIKDIASEAGLAPGTLYLYFDNKRDILRSFLHHAIGVGAARADEVSDLPLEEALVELLSERLAFLRAHSELLKVVYT